jgi:hypothetical protein
MRLSLGLLVVALLGLGVGCAELKSNKTVCEEYRGIRCATAPECSMDQARGCQVCQCSGAAYGPDMGLPNGLPPDRR